MKEELITFRLGKTLKVRLKKLAKKEKIMKDYGRL